MRAQCRVSDTKYPIYMNIYMSDLYPIYMSDCEFRFVTVVLKSACWLIISPIGLQSASIMA